MIYFKEHLHGAVKKLPIVCNDLHLPKEMVTQDLTSPVEKTQARSIRVEELLLTCVGLDIIWVKLKVTQQT